MNTLVIARYPAQSYFILCRVCDYISAGLDAKLVDPDGGVHSNRLRARFESEVAIPNPLPSDGWTSSLSQLPSFNYSCL